MAIKIYLRDGEIIKQEKIQYDEVIIRTDLDVEDKLVVEGGKIIKYYDSVAFADYFSEKKAELNAGTLDNDEDELRKIKSIAKMKKDTTMLGKINKKQEASASKLKSKPKKKTKRKKK